MKQQDKLSLIINSFSTLSSNSMEKMKELVQYVSIDKGELLAELGKKNDLEYFILDGICKSFIYSPDGEDITLSFFMSKSIISPHTIRSENGKSLVNIRTLTPVDLATINAQKFEELMVEDLEIRQFGNAVLRNELINKVQKEIGLASLPGKNRLKNLRAKFPNIENLIPHSDIASYLGITTISLSRLRKQS